jgi:hypothetical protein
MPCTSESLRGLIGPDLSHRSSEQDPDAPIVLWERAAGSDEWYHLTAIADLGELAERVRRLLRYRWPDQSAPLEWCATRAGEAPATVDRPLLYVSLTWAVGGGCPDPGKAVPAE